MTPETRIELAGVGPVACIATSWREAGALRVTIMVKAAFALVPDGAAALRSGAPIVPVDRHFEGSARRSIEAPGDIAPRKLKADVMVMGHAHAPGGKAAPSSSVRLGVLREGQGQGGAMRVLVDKTLHIYGDRTRALPSPQPFSRMPIHYERAYGGPSSTDNPVGVGLDGSAALPNLVDPGSATARAGYGPIPRIWPVRAGLLSQGDQRALAERVPITIREGFPWAYFQCAPPDQQTDFLQGDELLIIDGMSPNAPRVQTKLPGVRAKARVFSKASTMGGPEGGPPKPPSATAEGTPVPLRCDTWLIDTDRMLSWLTFRGDFAAGVEEAELSSLRVVAGIEIAGVPVGKPVDPPAPPPPSQPKAIEDKDKKPEAHTALVSPALAALMSLKPSMPFAAPKEGSAPAPPPPPSAPRPPAEDAGFTQAVTPELMAKLATPFDAPPPNEPRSPSTSVLSAEEQKKIDEAVATPWGTPAPSSQPSSTSEGLPFMVDGKPAAPIVPAKKPLPMGGTLPVDLPPLALPAPAPIPAPPKPAPPPIAAPPIPISAPPIAAPPIPISAPSKPAPPPAPQQKPEDVREEVKRRLATGAPLSGLSLAKVDLSGLDLSGADLQGMSLREAKLDKAKLNRANLSGADLSSAQAEGAVFEGARADKAIFVKGRFKDAVFDKASLAGADFSGASLAKASLRDADLSGATLTDAKLLEAVLDGARADKARADGISLLKASLAGVHASEIVLDRASLSDTRWSGATLKGASLAGAMCGRASFASVDLSDAKMGRATADHADFSNSTLDRADLTNLRAKGARFDGAHLRAIRGARADLSESSFAGADLTGASLRPSRLVKADFSGATLDNADMRDADLSGATLLGTSRHGTKTMGARMSDVIDG